MRVFRTVSVAEHKPAHSGRVVRPVKASHAVSLILAFLSIVAVEVDVLPSHNVHFEFSYRAVIVRLLLALRPLCASLDQILALINGYKRGAHGTV